MSDAAIGPSKTSAGNARAAGVRDTAVGVLRTAVLWRAVLAVTVIIVAYHYSLLTLVRALGIDSPLAYLGMIPIISLAMIIATAPPALGDLDVHDRYLDKIIGIPLVVVPLLVLTLLPAQMSTYFWVWRIDLLTMPLFVAGVIALLFGTRVLLRSRLGLLWLFAAWPVPFQIVVQRGLEPFTELTVRSLESLTNLLPLATRLGDLEGGFEIDGPSGAFTVVVASACSGANSLVGFVLVGGALAALSRGTKRAKLSWIAAGSALVWLLNVLRIAMIFVVGSIWGERAAIDIFHPYIGLVFFTLALTFMVLNSSRFGLTLGGVTRDYRALDRSVTRGVPAWRSSGVVLVVLGVVMGLLNQQLSSVDPVAGALGTPRIAAFEQTALTLEGFDGEYSDTFAWTERFFGDDSDWSRYRFTSNDQGELHSSLPVIADVVTTGNVQAFNAFGVEACYRFHGYDLANERRVDLGNGVVGNVLMWKDPDRPITWTSVYWHWPIATPQGTRYQRVVLMYNTSAESEIVAPEPSSSVASSLGISLESALNERAGTAPGRVVEQADLTLDERAEQVKVFLVAFAQELITTAAGVSSELVDENGALK